MVIQYCTGRYRYWKRAILTYTDKARRLLTVVLAGVSSKPLHLELHLAEVLVKDLLLLGGRVLLLAGVGGVLSESPQLGLTLPHTPEEIAYLLVIYFSVIT